MLYQVITKSIFNQQNSTVNQQLINAESTKFNNKSTADQQVSTLNQQESTVDQQVPTLNQQESTCISSFKKIKSTKSEPSFKSLFFNNSLHLILYPFLFSILDLESQLLNSLLSG